MSEPAGKFNNSGIVHINERRQTESHPTHSGQLTVLCPCCNKVSGFWISAWVNEFRSGQKIPGARYFSLKIKPKDQPKAQAKPTAATRGLDPGPEPDVPPDEDSDNPIF